MKKSVSVLISLSMTMATVPAFAQSSTSSASSVASSASSVSSSSVSSMSAISTKPCADKTGDAKIVCLRQQAMARVKTQKPTQRMSIAAKERIAACKDKTGLSKVLCMFKRMEKKQDMVQKFEQKVQKNIIKFSRRHSSKSSKAKGFQKSSVRSPMSSVSSSSVSSVSSGASSVSSTSSN